MVEGENLVLKVVLYPSWVRPGMNVHMFTHQINEWIFFFFNLKNYSSELLFPNLGLYNFVGLENV